jgi:hypothetical protein
MLEGKSSRLVTLCALSLTLSPLYPGQAGGNQSVTNPRSNASTTPNEASNESPLACNILALDAKQRQRIQELLKEFRSKTLEIRELENGYAFRLPAESELARKAAEYIRLERMCCPFFDFALSAKREGGPIRITLSGREGVKEFAKAEFDIGPINPATSSSAPITAKESPLVCNDQALSGAELRRLAGLLKEFRTSKQAVREFPDGYGIQLPAQASFIQDAGDYMAILRLCSPYFEPTLEVSREGGPIWLRLAGRPGVKELAKAELKISTD